jgi:hypothetical protein
VITLTSGDRDQVGLVSPRHGRLVPGDLETNATWCDQHRCSANFVVLSLDYPGYIGFTDPRSSWRRSANPRGPTTSVPTRYWSGTRSC